MKANSLTLNHMIVDPMRSRIMAAIKGKDTKPEMIVRRHLHAAGFRYSLHQKDLPGRPDLVLRKHRSVVLVQGCFWHGHHCKTKMPSTRAAWWAAKIEANRQRDVRTKAALKALGWRVHEIWECDLRKAGALEALAADILAGPQEGSQLSSRVMPPAELR